MAGMSGCCRPLWVSPFFLYTKPDKYARSHGALGCLLGLIASPFFIIAYVLYGVCVVFTDRILTGFHNQVGENRKLFVYDRHVQYRVWSKLSIVEELNDFPRPVGKRRDKIDEAIEIAEAANDVFESSHAIFSEEHWHWRVARADSLKRKLLPGLRVLTHQEITQVSRLLDMEGKHEISFSRFCLFIGKAVKTRFRQRDEMSTRPSFRDVYGSAHSAGSLMKA